MGWNGTGQLPLAKGLMVNLRSVYTRAAQRKFSDADSWQWPGGGTMFNPRPYSRGWASHKYREFFGVWPQGLRDVPATPTQELLNWIKSRDIAFAKGREKGVRHAPD